MSLYTATICKDGAGSQVVVHWDDKDPNRIITAPIMVDHPVASEDEFAELIASQGWRLVSKGSDNIGRGWAVVARTNGERAFYNPLNGSWQSFLTDDQKREINSKYPDAEVPGCRRRNNATTGWDKI